MKKYLVITMLVSTSGIFACANTCRHTPIITEERFDTLPLDMPTKRRVASALDMPVNKVDPLINCSQIALFLSQIDDAEERAKVLDRERPTMNKAKRKEVLDHAVKAQKSSDSKERAACVTRCATVLVEEYIKKPAKKSHTPVRKSH